MPECEETANWRTLYREAIHEQDRGKLPTRVARAQHAIRSRALQLWYAGPTDATERRQIDAASHHLRLLCAMGVGK